MKFRAGRRRFPSTRNCFLSGTLASTTAQRQRRGAIQLRPGLAHIQRLQPYYRIALVRAREDEETSLWPHQPWQWSSMGKRNMAIAVKTLVERGQIGHVDLVLDRRACVQVIVLALRYGSASAISTVRGILANKQPHFLTPCEGQNPYLPAHRLLSRYAHTRVSRRPPPACARTHGTRLNRFGNDSAGTTERPPWPN